MSLLEMLKGLNVWEWVFWIVVAVFSIKGYIEYPNTLKEKEKAEKAYNGKASLQQ